MNFPSQKQRHWGSIYTQTKTNCYFFYNMNHPNFFHNMNQGMATKITENLTQFMNAISKV